MANSCRAGQPLYDRLCVKMVADKALAPLGMKLAAIEANNSSRLLAAVLQRMKPDGRDCSSVGVIENPENPAFLVQSILFGVEDPSL
jgi:hypothetical protein